MKLKLSLIAFLLFSTAAGAQTENEAKPAHQIGVNATFFVKQFLSFNDLIVPNNPYNLTYKYIEDKQGWRVGLGGNNATQKSNPNNGQSISNSKSLSIATRLGYEWQKPLDNRWLAYYGADVTYSYTKNRTTSRIPTGGFPQTTEEILVSNESFAVGGGPVLGIEFKLSKRISFNAETSLYFAYSEFRRNDINAFFIGSKQTDFSARTSTAITLPTSLFFIISI